METQELSEHYTLNVLQIIQLIKLIPLFIKQGKTWHNNDSAADILGTKNFALKQLVFFMERIPQEVGNIPFRLWSMLT